MDYLPKTFAVRKKSEIKTNNMQKHVCTVELSVVSLAGIDFPFEADLDTIFDHGTLFSFSSSSEQKRFKAQDR